MTNSVGLDQIAPAEQSGLEVIKIFFYAQLS